MTNKDKEKLHQILSSLWKNDNSVGKIYYNQALQDAQIAIESLQEEVVSEDFEEACEQLAENARKHKAETISPFFSPTDYKQGVIDGAKWQKEQIMKDAIGREVAEGSMCPAIESLPVLTHTDMILLPKDKFKSGDKVKLIIIKEE